MKYDKHKLVIDMQKENIERVLEIINELKTRRIMGYKFNYALEESVQNFTCFHCYIEFDE